MALVRATKLDFNVVTSLVDEFHRYEGITVDVELRDAAVNVLLQPDATAGAIYLVKDTQHTVLGYIVLCFGFSIESGGKDAFVDELYLKPAARGRGVGKTVLNEIEGIARNAGVTKLHLEVSRDNSRAKHYYMKAGFAAREKYHLMSLTFNA